MEDRTYIWERIDPLDEGAMARCRERWMHLAVPLHSLGTLEDMVIRIAGITGDAEANIGKKALVNMCADNGIVEEGVTQSGQDVTAVVTDNFVTGQSASAIMCRKLGVDLFPVDIGVNNDTIAIPKKIRRGTANFTKGPAMSREEALQAIRIGIDTVKELKDKGYGLIATGEMGIGNTTTSSAITSVLLNVDPAEVTGRGAGLSSEGLERKIEVIRRGIEINRPDKNDPIDVLSKVGGLDIAGIVGIYLGGAIYRVPILMDGVISCAAALAASRLNPLCVSYMIPTHFSAEPATRFILGELGLNAPFHMGMHLGEGTGALAMVPMIELGLEVYRTMGVFGEVKIEQYKEYI